MTLPLERRHQWIVCGGGGGEGEGSTGTAPTLSGQHGHVWARQTVAQL